MAGKSTYLRIDNHLLASVGLPVNAEIVVLSGRLLTNLCTSDSLVNSESYSLQPKFEDDYRPVGFR